jgi:hypothetical protein
MCVRQFGTEWRCMESRQLGVGSCHRDYKVQVDSGYLDVEYPSNVDSAATVEEIMENDRLESRERYSQHEENNGAGVETQSHPVLERVPPLVMQLLVDLGFTEVEVSVTGQKMKRAWTTATEVDYLAKIDLAHGSQLAPLSRDGEAIIRVRAQTEERVLRTCGLCIASTRDARVPGQFRGRTYTLKRTT